MWITENNLTSLEQTGYGMLEQILSPANLNAAYKRVKQNKGAGGIDEMQVESLKDYLIEEKDALIATILGGKYRPNPVRRVVIPKENGKHRELGIPTVVDRVIQQAITQVLSPVYEKQFSTQSYGFRPKRNAHQALQQCQRYITEGYQYAVDMENEVQKIEIPLFNQLAFYAIINSPAFHLHNATLPRQNPAKQENRARNVAKNWLVR